MTYVPRVKRTYTKRRTPAQILADKNAKDFLRFPPCWVVDARRLLTAGHDIFTVAATVCHTIPEVEKACFHPNGNRIRKWPKPRKVA